MRAAGWWATVLAALALSVPALAEDGEGGLDVRLSPRSTALEPGEAYLVPFTVTYDCGATRRIDLQVSYPFWSEAAVEDFETRADRCQAPARGEHKGDVVLAVDASAPPGQPGNLTLVAWDGDQADYASVEVRVRPQPPHVRLGAAGALPADVAAGRTALFNVTAYVTLRESADLRWIVESPDGWDVAMPAVSEVPAGTEVRVTGAFAASVPADAAGGAAALVVQAALIDGSGARIAKSEPLALGLRVVPSPFSEPPELPARDEPLRPTDVSAAREEVRPAPALLWAAVAGLVLAAVAGLRPKEKAP